MPAKNVLNGYYRIRNSGSGSLLSGVSHLKDDQINKIVGELPPFAIAAKACEEDVSSQVWIIREAPKDNVDPRAALDIATGSQSPSAAPDVYQDNNGNQLVIELAKSSVGAGSGFPFRLEVRNKSENHEPLVLPEAPGLLDPDFPLPPNNFSFISQTSSTATEAGLSPSFELVAAPRGGTSTVFQFISINEIESGVGSVDNFLIYHPQTKSYLAESQDNNSNQNGSIILVTEAQLAELIENGSDGAHSDSLEYLRWTIQSEPFGPRRGDFRLIHSLSLTALGAVPSLAPSGIEEGSLIGSQSNLDETDTDVSLSISGGELPSFKLLNPANCISNDLKWSITPRVTGGVSYTLSNQQRYLSIEDSGKLRSITESESSQPQARLWKFMFVPSTKVATPEIPGIYAPPPKHDLYAANLHYILYKEEKDFDIFLGLLRIRKEERYCPAIVSLKVSHSKDPEGEPISGCSNRVTRLLRRDPVEFWRKYGWLIWRMNVFKRLPPDGIYTISPKEGGNSKLLGISEIYPTATKLNLLENTTIEDLGTGSWLWNVSTQVADNGVVYQYIKNYHTGHNINIFKNEITAFRTGRDSRWKRWHIISADTISLEDGASELCLWTSHAVRSLSVKASPEANPTALRLVGDDDNSGQKHQWWEFKYVEFSKPIADVRVRFDVTPRFITHQPDDFVKDSYLPDGLYKIEHKFTKSNLVADSFATDDTIRLTKTIGVEEFASTDTYARSIWYIKRDLQSTDITHTYTLTNMDNTSYPMKLQERYDILLQPYTGVTVALKSGAERGKQQWRLWKHKTLGYVIQNRGGSGGILGVTKGMILSFSKLPPQSKET
ncbi:hypothetical protein TWF718_009124 [Orbilia javanica]|uniref:Uncharacterized protein n=1 Tax=Orbilia javanica TaxID=47235 RepID=A0AAN8MM59_9PEZI